MMLQKHFYLLILPHLWGKVRMGGVAAGFSLRVSDLKIDI